MPAGVDDPNTLKRAIMQAETAKRDETQHLRRVFLNDKVDDRE